MCPLTLEASHTHHVALRSDTGTSGGSIVRYWPYLHTSSHVHVVDVPQALHRLGPQRGGRLVVQLQRLLGETLLGREGGALRSLPWGGGECHTLSPLCRHLSLSLICLHLTPLFHSRCAVKVPHRGTAPQLTSCSTSCQGVVAEDAGNRLPCEAPPQRRVMMLGGAHEWDQPPSAPRTTVVDF